MVMDTKEDEEHVGYRLEETLKNEFSVSMQVYIKFHDIEEVNVCSFGFPLSFWTDQLPG